MLEFLVLEIQQHKEIYDYISVMFLLALIHFTDLLYGV